jgi:hypothetical protein
MKAYAVTSETRLTLAPDIPTVTEVGLPALSYTAWLGLFAPKGTPKDVIGKLNAATVEALGDPAVQSRLADLGYQVFPGPNKHRKASAAGKRLILRNDGRSSRNWGSKQNEVAGPIGVRSKNENG